LVGSFVGEKKEASAAEKDQRREAHTDDPGNSYARAAITGE